MATIDVRVGTLTKPHGVRGGMAVEMHTDEPERRFAVGQILRGPSGPLTVSALTRSGGRYVVTFREVPDRNAAEALRGAVLHAEVDADDAPADDEEFYDRDLVGMAVWDHQGVARGQIVDVIHAPAQDVLVADIDGHERLIPFVQALVPGIDLTQRVVHIADVPGLLEDLDDDDEPADDGSDKA